MSTTTTATRTFDGTDIPVATTYQIDPAHSLAGFVARHMVVTKVRGRFTEVSGGIHIAEEPLESSVEVEIATSSLTTNNADRDAHLLSPDFFDSERYPTISFRSTGVEAKGGSRFLVAGDLTIRGTTRPVVLDTTYEGAGRDPWGNERVAFSASTTVNREDWGLTWNQPLETGGLLVSKEITIEIEAQAVRPA